MLATVTPLAERGRGHRYRSTAAWFIAGGTAGGATLGLVMAALACGVRAAAPTTTALAAVAGAVALLAAASDTRFGGFRLPFHSRQVNERWLDQFRPWVYGAGFGWQIGAGLATYIKTAALYLMIVLAALTMSPGIALGARRAVRTGARAGRPARPAHHEPGRPRRVPPPLHRGRAVVLGVVVACELAVAVAVAAVLSLWLALALALLAGAVGTGDAGPAGRPLPSGSSA